MNKKILTSISYGMYAIGVKGPNGPSACIVNTVSQVNEHPPIISVSLNNSHYATKCINKLKIFTISTLSEDTSGAIIGALGFFSGQDTNKLKNVNFHMLEEDIPVIKENCCCWFLCKVISYVPLDTHTVFVAKVIAGSEKIHGVPMTYAYYKKVIKGASPKGAPTYFPDKIVNQNDDYVCSICGYVYSDPYVPFEDLGDSWVCPICGVAKSLFKKR